jgi:hypothetical protein
MNKLLLQIATLLSVALLLTSCDTSGNDFNGEGWLIFFILVLPTWYLGKITKKHYLWLETHRGIYGKEEKFWKFFETLEKKVTNRILSKKLTDSPIVIFSLLIIYLALYIVVFIALFVDNSPILYYILFPILTILTPFTTIESDKQLQIQSLSWGELLIRTAAEIIMLLVKIAFWVVIVCMALAENNKSGSSASSDTSNIDKQPDSQLAQPKESGCFKSPNYTILCRYPSGSATIENTYLMYSEHTPTIDEAKAYIIKNRWGENYDHLQIIGIFYGAGGAKRNEYSRDNLI